MTGAMIAFVGENENGILRHLSEGLMGLMRPYGYEPHLIDFADPVWPARLDAVLKQGPVAMAWGHAGVGAKLELEGQNIWDLVKVPFISVLADPPCWRPCNHSVPSRYVVNAYLYPEWLRVQERFIQSRQLSALVRGGLVPNPFRDRIPWNQRPRRMVLVKTGADAEARRRGWATLPPRMRAVLEDAAGVASGQNTGDVTEVLLSSMEAHHVTLRGRTDILFGLMTEVDRYVRDARSTAVVTALLDVPVDIYGRGWEHLSDRAGRARFHAAFDAEELPLLYSETQFLLNTTPNFSSGVHERVAYGFDARCCVVSDVNEYMREHLAGLPTFFGIDPTDPSVADRLQAIYCDPVDYTDLGQPAFELAAREFDGVRYMRSLLDLAEEVRVGEQFRDYVH